MDALEKKWAFACYIPIFNIITCPLAAVRRANSEFCRFHARQGMVIFFVWILTIFTALISQIVSLMLWGVVLLLYISGMVIVSKGLMSKFPVIGAIAMRIPEFYMYKLLTGRDPADLVAVEKRDDENKHQINQ